MEKVLFKFSTIRRPKKNYQTYKLVRDAYEIDILRAILSGESDQVVNDKIQTTIDNIPEYTSSGLFNTLLDFYDRLEREVKEKRISQESILEFVKEAISSMQLGPKETLNFKRIYSELLTAIQIKSNHTQEEQKEVFIALLKAWSVLDLIEAAHESSSVQWVDIYSATFVIPTKWSVALQRREKRTMSQERDTSQELAEKYNTAISDYRKTINDLNEVEKAIEELNEVAEFQDIEIKDLGDQKKLSDLATSKLFGSVFKNPSIQRRGIDSVRNEKLDKRLVSQVQTILNTKRATIVENLKKVIPDKNVNEKDVNTGAVLNTLLSEKVILENQASTLQSLIQNDFGVFVDPKFIPDTFIPPFKPLPIPVPTIPTLPTAEAEDVEAEAAGEALFELLISDLILVEEKDVGYKASAIAHIETAMEGELRSKEHRTLDRNESKLFSSESVGVQQHLNLATNAHSDFNTEVENSLKNKLGGEVRAGYKGTAYVDVKAYYDNETEKLEQTIKETAEQITEEARTEVTRKMLKERTEISISEVEIINKHQLENNFGKGHINGIYQWVDQVKELRALNYGRHLMTKFILLDPAKQLFEHQNDDPVFDDLPEFPFDTPFYIQSIEDALRCGRAYGVTDIESPPVATKHVTKVIEFSKKTTQEEVAGYLLHHVEIPIAGDGYEVTKVTVQYKCPWVDPDKHSERKQLTLTALGSSFEVSSIKGRFEFKERKDHGALGNGTYYYTEGPFEENHGYTAGVVAFSYLSGAETMGLREVPLTVMTRNNNYFQATVTIRLESDKFEPSDGAAYKEWQNRVYDQLYQAYLRKKEELQRSARNEKEDRLLRAISGQNPEKNRQIIQDELKHHVISALSKGFTHPSDRYTDQIGGASSSPDSRAAVKEYTELIDFFENAIDWEKMSYTFFSHHWLSRMERNARRHFEDTDPHFEAFMKSGAAETMIPVKRGFERKFIHYLNHRELWNYNEPLSLTSDEYNDILAEVNEFEAEEAEAKPIGSPWRVQIPTNLIILSEKNTLDEVPPLIQESEEENNG